MSGSSNRLMYDECATKLSLAKSLSPGNYKLYAGAYENEKACANNKNTNISSTMESIGKRTDIESNLRVLVRSTECNADKHKPCTVNSKDKHCNIGVPANPYLCDRSIVPNNLKKPTSSGF